MRQQKQKKFERTFSDPKFRFLPIFPNSSLREACNKNKIGWRLLITSDVFEIAEMFKDDISKREFHGQQLPCSNRFRVLLRASWLSRFR